MYRAPRAIDVVTTGVTMAGRTADARRVTAASGARSARTEGARRPERATAKRAAWARRASRRAPPCARARRAAPSADARCARAPPTEEPRALAAPSLLDDSLIDRWDTPEHLEVSRAEGKPTQSNAYT